MLPRVWRVACPWVLIAGLTGVAATALMPFSRSAFAWGSARAEDPFNAAHIDGLPSSIRRQIVMQERICGGARAGHYFALYLSVPNSRQKFVTLHYENFSCGTQSPLCSASGCLHQVFVSAGSAYRLAYSARVRDLEMKIVNGEPHLVLLSGGGLPAGPPTLRWNGTRFVKP